MGSQPVRLEGTGGSRPDLGDHPDWKQADHYAALARADRSVFAWEWLRRTAAYRHAWQRHCAPTGSTASYPRDYGLEQFEDPNLGAPQARPVWCASIDPAVIKATVQSFVAPRDDRIDLLQWSDLVTVAIDDDQVEHLLLSNGERALRIDILEGTLIGCPAALGYFLEGIHALQGPLSTLERLRILRKTGRLRHPALREGRSRCRWILELRVADAMLVGADQQEIARTIFGSTVASHRWRVASPAYRQRVQRLVRNARRRLDAPLDPQWFRSS